MLNWRIIGFWVVIIKDNKVLLGYQKRSYEEPCWAFPGWKLDDGETVLEGAKREVEEECWIVIDNLECITFFDDVYKDKHILSLVIKANSFTWEPQVLEPEKCDKWEWFDIDNLPENKTENFIKLINSKYWKQIVG